MFRRSIGIRCSSAFDAAQAAFPAWRGITAKERGAFLFRVADEVHKRADEIARLITLENGKPLAQSKGEMAMTEDHLRWFAEEGRRAYGRLIPHQAPGKRNMVVKTPIGVVGAIAPWNFPLVLGIRKAAPALAAGCPVVLKPSSQTPLSTIAFAECVEAAGIPGGVFQIVLGSARMIAGGVPDQSHLPQNHVHGFDRSGQGIDQGCGASDQAAFARAGRTGAVAGL